MMFEMLKLPAADVDGDELQRYLNAPVESVIDPVTWWLDRRSTFPRLSRMALDYLLIPGECFRISLSVCI